MADLMLFVLMFSSTLPLASSLECNTCNGNSCDPTQASVTKCTSSDDVCYGQATYKPLNKSVDIDNTVNKIHAKFECLKRADQTICEDERNFGDNCFSSIPVNPVEINCYYCCKGDQCNSVLPTRKLRSRPQPTSLTTSAKTASSKKCYSCTNVEKLVKPQPECLSQPNTTKTCSDEDVCQLLIIFEKTIDEEKFEMKHLSTVNRQCGLKSLCNEKNKWCKVSPDNKHKLECMSCCSENLCLPVYPNNEDLKNADYGKDKENNSAGLFHCNIFMIFAGVIMNMFLN